MSERLIRKKSLNLVWWGVNRDPCPPAEWSSSSETLSKRDECKIIKTSKNESFVDAVHLNFHMMEPKSKKMIVAKESRFKMKV